MKTGVQIVDYVEQGRSLYIQLKVVDAETGTTVEGEVRFLGELLYGELVHEKKSPLTDTARIETIAYLKAHFGR
ncbi:hypothetical protein BBI15_13340 [Planococcus plakortidis]|uniref:Uncharacterized protein n=1 Tax=Planococcus plakortidis TaxID=1038856 RepID=A0A1C7EB37_9BACL|nr:hypothetical protein [Planococcus plakortidis]ANU21100.1 hypothetical protein BBI15_13340 [Planococcus plakortidis]